MSLSVHTLCMCLCTAREGGRALQSLQPSERAAIIDHLADSLIDRQSDILAANQLDLEDARTSGRKQDTSIIIMVFI